MDLNLIPEYKKYDRWGLSVMDKKRESEWTDGRVERGGGWTLLHFENLTLDI